MNRSTVVVAVGAVVAACNPMSGAGTLQARWTTAAGDSAAVTMPVTGRWCVGPERLDIRAAVGDTGFGLAVFASDSAALAGSYPVLQPGGQVIIRPSSAIAIRWMSKILVQGWWGDSGSVTLAGSPSRGLSGNGTAWLVSGLGPDSVTTMRFSFKGVQVRNDTLCDAPVMPVAVPVDSAAPMPSPGVP